MDILDTKTEDELLRSILAEIAKSNNEINCAANDIKKARNRLGFLIVAVNKLIDRSQTDGTKETSKDTNA